MGRPILDLTGQKYGRLTVLRNVGVNKQGNALWECQCNCGAITIKASGDLRHGTTYSCGCWRRENGIKNGFPRVHGMSNTRLNVIWNKMTQRCHNPVSPNYQRYGGRGITICDEWRNDFQAFHDWAVTHGYSDNLTIDRIDNDGNYEPSNCRWATVAEQNRNKGHQANNTSGITGVRFNVTRQKWTAHIGHKGKLISLGCYATIEQAAEARKLGEIKYWNKDA